MKTKAILEAILAAVVTTIAFYRRLLWPGIAIAVWIRRKMPDAWFAGLIVFYATIVVLGASIAIGAVACRLVYKHALRSTAGLRDS